MSEQEQFEAWWNGDRPTDFTEYGASQWTKAHAYSAWLARASRPRASGDAPEACPVAWTIMGNGRIVGDTDVWTSRDDAEECCAVYKAAAPSFTEEYRVVPLYAQPASATAEGGGEEIVAHTPLPRGLVLWQHETGRTMVMPEAKDPCFGWRRVTQPATPASAAWREGAVEKVVEAAKALAPFLPDAGASTSERWILWERGVDLAKQLRALLAAEAAERGEKEA